VTAWVDLVRAHVLSNACVCAAAAAAAARKRAMVPDVTSAPTRAAREAISRFDDDVGTRTYGLQVYVFLFVLFFVFFRRASAWHSM
jgi:hypothetical protein